MILANCFYTSLYLAVLIGLLFPLQANERIKLQKCPTNKAASGYGSIKETTIDEEDKYAETGTGNIDNNCGFFTFIDRWHTPRLNF